MKFVLGLLSGLVLAALGGLAYLSLGFFDISASREAPFFEKQGARIGMRAWLEKRAKDVKNPRPPGPEVLREGLLHYRENCAVCHGVPGRPESEIAQGMNPPPPDLTRPATQRMTDGQLFLVVSNGIRMTGMPSFAVTHGEPEIWSLVAFVRHLPDVTEEERALLAAGMPEGGAHHHGGGGHDEEPHGRAP